MLATLKPLTDLPRMVYALQHLENAEFICLFDKPTQTDYLACFSDGDTAMEFRSELRLQEYVDVVGVETAACPFTHLWLDGDSISIPRSEAEERGYTT